MANTGFLYIPLSSYEGQALADATKNGTTGFNENGDLETRGENQYRGKLVIAQQEYPYNALLEQLRTRAMKVMRMRVTVQTDAQIDTGLTHFRRSQGGKFCSNATDARAFLQPTQYQGRIIDIDQEFIIDRYSGLYMLVKSGERVNFAFFTRNGTQFNISVFNSAIVDLHAELFAPLDSISRRSKPEYVNNDVVNVAGTAAVFLDATGYSAVNFPAFYLLQAYAPNLTDYVDIPTGGSQLIVRAPLAGSTFQIKLPTRGHGTFLTDYSLGAGLTFVSAALSGGNWIATLSFIGFAPLNITSL